MSVGQQLKSLARSSAHPGFLESNKLLPGDRHESPEQHYAGDCARTVLFYPGDKGSVPCVQVPSLVDPRLSKGIFAGRLPTVFFSCFACDQRQSASRTRQVTLPDPGSLITGGMAGNPVGIWLPFVNSSIKPLFRWTAVM
ncbi:hypothetical protein I7I51_07158 [Histoplasma capsulatum]|uniref:Uncharacterized protein n=1 Tax=Ajellomyces capsulatus TaxID=5037 RepID=A0A8A1MJN2_AJECA|nr:hypothetical protein I7I51_07158 [Histoplasma capsulatum]